MILASRFCSSQIVEPVKWTCDLKKIGEKRYEVQLKARIDAPFHIYSQFTSKDAPNLPTSIKFKQNPLIQFDGNVKEEGKMIVSHEDLLDVDLKYYSDAVMFTQIIRLKANVKTSITGTIEYMACTEEKCLPKQNLQFTLSVD